MMGGRKIERLGEERRPASKEIVTPLETIIRFMEAGDDTNNGDWAAQEQLFEPGSEV
jgi:hypothetical protein